MAGDTSRRDTSRKEAPVRLDEGGDPNLLPSGERERDFGDSAGYGGGGSTRDYQEVVGESPVTAGRPNPLDAVIPPEPPADQDEEREDPAPSG